MALGLAGILAVLTGPLPATDAREAVLVRGGPILGFLVAVTLLAELADKAESSTPPPNLLALQREQMHTV